MSENLIVPTMAEMLAQGKQPEVLFWVGCAGSFDDRAKKITKAFVRILNRANVPLQYSVPKRVAQVIRQKSRK
jgi:Fe-S oxidoreductase